MKAPDSQLAVSLGKFTSILLKEKLIEDDESLSTAISLVAQQCMNIETPPKTSKKSARIFNLERIIANSEKNKEKLEIIKRQLYHESLLQTSDKPTINENSKKMCSGYSKSVLERTQQDIDKRNKKLKAYKEMKAREEDENVIKTCTFMPNNRRKPTRSPSRVVEDLYRWKRKKDENLKRSQGNREQEILEACTPKPEIDKTSQKLSLTRSLTPVVDRLAKQNIEKNSFNVCFYPNNNPNETTLNLENTRSQIEKSKVHLMKTLKTKSKNSLIMNESEIQKSKTNKMFENKMSSNEKVITHKASKLSEDFEACFRASNEKYGKDANIMSYEQLIQMLSISSSFGDFHT